MFVLHPQLAADSILLGRFPLCHLLLLNDTNYPWFVLVPDRADRREIYELDAADRQQLLDESCRLSEFLMAEFGGDKLNLAALGNLVPQLHLHHIVRYRSDPAWPGPVWGRFAAKAYGERELQRIRNRVLEAGLEEFTPT